VSGPVTADLTTTVVHSSKLLINDVKPHHSLTHLPGSAFTMNSMVVSSDRSRFTTLRKDWIPCLHQRL